MRMASYDFKEIEKKWIGKYDGFAGYKGLDFEADKQKFYMLTEFPYPSGSGLHVGHGFAMTGADVYARYQRMMGKNVMFPMGWDAFGLPTENYAIKSGKNPKEITKEVTDNFRMQMRKLGFSFDWDREVNSTMPDYYKWTQWIFVKLFEKGLAHKEEMPINWCPKDKIGLANEEVIDGKCERCGSETEKRTISQWVVKITDYADRLLEGLKDTDFIEKVKAAQVNWIGKKEGAKIKFEIKTPDGFRVKPGMTGRKSETDILEVFTSRPDTLPGATFLVLAPEHPMVKHLMENSELIGWIPGQARNDIKRYLDEVKGRSEIERTDDTRAKTGVFTGIYAVNPLNNKEIPIWISDYVLMGYGTGAIMAVPAHDDRDKAFADKYNLPIDSEFVPDDLIISLIEEKGFGEKAVTYHLRDWIFSRQHYWGEPIPMIWCENCVPEGDGFRVKPGMTGSWIPVPEKDLPVVLPEVEKYQPTDTGESPLANIKEWVETTCPNCGGKAKRETDTMPNWAGSDWYFLRYCDPKNREMLASQEKMEYWMPVDVYVGGDEHNTLHLLYSRFIYQFLWDLGVVPKIYPEPYKKRLSHGVLLGPDGNRMSKSKGNVIVPDVVAETYGADVLRTYMMFMGPFDSTMAWNERSLVGVRRFIEKIFRLVTENAGKYVVTDLESSRLIHKLIKGAGEDLSQFKFNTVIAKLMETTNALLRSGAEVSSEDLGRVVKVLAPFAPFVTEELWNLLGGEFSVHAQEFPKFEEKYLMTDVITISVQINGKMRETIEVENDASEEAVVDTVKKIEKLEKYLLAGEIKKIIYIKGKTINFVVA